MDSAQHDRHFWRRFLAYVIDYVVFQLTIGLVILIAMSFALPETTMFEQAGEPGTSLTEAQTAFMAERYGADWATNKIAMSLTADAALRKPVSVLIIGDIAKDDESRPFPTMLIDRGDGNYVPIDARDYVPWLLVGLYLMPLMFAAMNADGRRSFGKKAAGLAVLRANGEPPSLVTALIREVLKFGVSIGLGTYLILAVTNYINDMLHMQLNDASGALLQAGFFNLLWVSLGCWVLGMAYWMLPFMLWRGQTTYDWLTGLFVVDVRPAQPAMQARNG